MSNNFNRYISNIKRTKYIIIIRIIICLEYKKHIIHTIYVHDKCILFYHSILNLDKHYKCTMKYDFSFKLKIDEISCDFFFFMLAESIMKLIIKYELVWGRCGSGDDLGEKIGTEIKKANNNLKQKAIMNRNLYCPGALITNRRSK